jgi:hypothetical protein
MNVAKMCMQHVWIFTGIEGRGFPGGVFLDRETAEEWIRKHRLWGTLTLYAVNVGNYEHAIAMEWFRPQKPDEFTPDFIASFSTAHQEHYHYEDGI